MGKNNSKRRREQRRAEAEVRQALWDGMTAEERGKRLRARGAPQMSNEFVKGKAL